MANEDMQVSGTVMLQRGAEPVFAMASALGLVPGSPFSLLLSDSGPVQWELQWYFQSQEGVGSPVEAATRHGWGCCRCHLGVVV